MALERDSAQALHGGMIGRACPTLLPHPLPPSSCRLEVEVAVEGGSAEELQGLAVQARLYLCDEAGEVDPAGARACMADGRWTRA